METILEGEIGIMAAERMEKEGVRGHEMVVIEGAWDVIGASVWFRRDENGEGVESLVREADEAFEGGECGVEVSRL